MENENNFKQEWVNNENVTVVAVLNDLSGNKYYLKTNSGRYIWLNSNLNDYEEVNEQTVLSSIMKHDYKTVTSSESFIFSSRKKYLS